MIFYLDVCRKAKLEPGWINHEGFTKRSQQSSVGSMPTSMSMKERSTKTRKEKGFQIQSMGNGGGQNANKLCKKHFVKPT